MVDKLISVLMFHALHKDDVLCNADEHYAMSKLSFDDLVQKMSVQNIAIESIRNICDIHHNTSSHVAVFTFDDGHISNYEDAFPILKKQNASADFFINTAYVASKGYMDWNQICEMNDGGMSIQSHGHHHYYFDDLDKKAITDELEISKKMIEDKIGREVTVFAPPGGRITSEVKDIALKLGYTSISTSCPGLWSSLTPLDDIPRLPVLRSTSVDLALAWVNTDKSKINKVIAKYYITSFGKRLLGNTAYDKLRSFVIGN